MVQYAKEINKLSVATLVSSDSSNNFLVQSFLCESNRMDSSSDESGPTYPLPVVDTLPTFSKERYDQTYQLFRKWMVTKNRASLSQGVLLQFFNELATKKKPSTVWTYYSILKATIRANDNIDIRGYEVLTKFIKCKTTGYSPAKAGVFNAEDIHRFLKEAPDERWLDVKVN